MKPRILVIDDDAHVRDALRVLLERRGYLVQLAKDGREGLVRLAAEPTDLIITDVVMPDQDGIETILAVRKTDARMPIIAISGGSRLDSDFYVRMALSLGATRVLKKPFDAADLYRCLDELLGNPAPRPQSPEQDSGPQKQAEREHDRR